MFDIVAISGFIGSVAFALSGFLVGARKQLDVVGIFILCLLTANGGGAVRDILLNRPPLVLETSTPFLIVITVMLLAWAVRLERFATLERKIFFILCDAIGLAAFSVTGAMAGIEAGLPLFGVMALAFITATGGGIIRDMLVREVPLILSSDFYGTVALIVAAALFGLHHYGLGSQFVTGTVLLAALALRMVAYTRQWHLPRYR